MALDFTVLALSKVGDQLVSKVEHLATQLDIFSQEQVEQKGARGRVNIGLTIGSGPETQIKHCSAFSRYVNKQLLANLLAQRTR